MPVSRNVPLMPAAAYLGIWGPNNTKVACIFNGNSSLGRQKGLTVHQPCTTVGLGCSWGVCLDLGTREREVWCGGGKQEE